jgi:biotin carboxyl carrier protein
MKVKIKLGQEEHELNVTKSGDMVRVERNGQVQELKLREQNGSGMVLEYNGRLVRMAGHKEGDKRQLWVNGRVVVYERVQKRAGSMAAAAGSLSASIPAVVSEVLVSEGDEVKAGDKLILLESMKMIIPIQAPTDGIVQAVHCAAGDSVQPGVPLLVIE